MSNNSGELPEKCVQCKKAINTNTRLTRIPVDEAVSIFVLSSKNGIRQEIHMCLCEFMEKIGKTLIQNMLWGKPGEPEGRYSVLN